MSSGAPPRGRSASEDGGAGATDLAARTAAVLVQMLVRGEVGPAQQLHEEKLAAELSVSRNTLREAYRILIQQGLIERRPNRGVFVKEPSLADILDIYHVRRIIEHAAVRQATHAHPGLPAVIDAVERAERFRDAGEWEMVGTMNMVFHASLVALADSERLDELFERLQAELRLAFASLRDPQRLHSPFVEENRAILELLRAGRMSDAADALDTYLTRSERTVIAALGRRRR